MQAHRSPHAAMLTLALTPACGGSSTTAATAGDVAGYREMALDVNAAATDYQAAMLGGEMTTVQACHDVHDQYDAGVRPLVAQMGGMSDRMDAVMGEHGGGARVDMGCAAEEMLSELDRHHSAACGWANLATDQEEAVRHAGLMTSYAAHLEDRSNEVLSWMSGGMASWGPMMSGCVGWSGAGGMMHGGSSR